jgi:hypothetical protein
MPRRKAPAHRIRLVHWHAEEAAERARLIASAGYQVVSAPPVGSAGFKEVREGKEDVVVIDLSRKPSMGEYLGVSLRQRKSSRFVPVIFVGGKDAMIEKLGRLMPDAIFTGWDAIDEAIGRALAQPVPPTTGAIPTAALWAGRSLATKLGIRAGSRVHLVDAPEDFEERLGEMPEDVTIRNGASMRADVTIWFVTSRDELEGKAHEMAEVAVHGRRWIAWPKASSGVRSDLNQYVLREICNLVDLADYKMLSLDGTWSGMAFGRRRA